LIEQLDSTRTAQKVLSDYWLGRYWDEVPRLLSVFRVWAPEFFNYAIRRARNVCAEKILDYTDGSFVMWAVGICLDVFHVEWNAARQQKDYIFGQAMAGINLVGILIKFNCPEDQLEDIAQEVWMRVWLAFDRYDPRRAQFLTWVTAISRNAIRDIGRRAYRSGAYRYQQIPLLDELMADEDNPIGQIMDVLDQLEAAGQLSLVSAIQAYLGGEGTMPDLTEAKFLLLEDNYARLERS